jgi:hypothetical protein
MGDAAVAVVRALANGSDAGVGCRALAVGYANSHVLGLDREGPGRLVHVPRAYIAPTSPCNPTVAVFANVRARVRRSGDLVIAAVLQRRRSPQRPSHDRASQRRIRDYGHPTSPAAQPTI